MNFDSGTWFAIAAVVAVVSFLLYVYISAKRFAAKQRQLGRWDQYGPLEETEPPPNSPRGGKMNERLEVIGKWRGKVVRRRLPNEKP